MPTIQELTAERAKILTGVTELSARVKAEQDRDLNPEERSQVDKAVARATEIESELARQKEDSDASAAAKSALDKLVTDAKRNDNRRSTPPGDTRTGAGKAPLRLEETDEYRDYFGAAITCNKRAMYAAESRIEQRALSLGTNSAGGFMALPTALLEAFIQNVDELSGVAAKATRIPVGDAKSLGVVTTPTRGNDADWTTEIATVNIDSGMSVGRHDFTPWMLTKEADASMSLLNRTEWAQSFILKQLARLFAVTIEKAMITGTGSSQPLGLQVASANGIDTSRDITASATTTFTYQDIVNVKYAVKQAHLRKAEWVIHRDVMKTALNLLDGEGRPIFAPSMAPGLQDYLLGQPVNYSEFAPNTFTTGLYLAVLGDMSHYYLVDAMTYSVQVADQIAARTNQVAFIARAEIDGAPTLPEAFARLKLA